MDWKEFCGNCKRQGLCCSIEPIYVTKKEEKRIAKETGVESVTKNNLLLKNKKSCIFIKNKLCEINEIKPLDCRAYPVVFWSDAGNGRVSYFLDLDCPKAMKLTKKDVQEIQRMIKSEVKDWEKKDLYKYDVCAYWKPEKLKKKLRKNKQFPFGVDL